MTEKPTSGNRWEPDSTQPISATPGSAPETPPENPASTPPQVPTAGASVPAPVESATWRGHVTRSRAGLLAVALAVLLLGGLGGFALGHAAGGGDQSGPGRFLPGQGPGTTPGQRPDPGDGHRHGFGPRGTPPSEAPGQDGSGTRTSSSTFDGALGAGA